MAELIILGSGTGVPTLRRGAPGLLLFSEGSTILIDSGSGTLRRMLEVQVTYQDIDLLLYTHIHPDHTADLIPILFACKYAHQPRQKDLTLASGPGFRDYFKNLKAIYGPWIKPRSYRLILKSVLERPFNFGEVRILSKPMAHLPGSVGYRIEMKDGKSIAISGDTDYCQNIVDLGSGVDLLVLECSFPDARKVEGHLTPGLAGRIGTESRCKKLLLTHLYPECDQIDILEQCRKAYNRPGLILAEDLLRIRV